MPYTDMFKNAMIQKMTGPDAISASALSRQIDVPQSTLSKWLRMAGVGSSYDFPNTAYGYTKMAKIKGPKRPNNWSPEEKLKVVMEAAALDDEQLGAFLRKKGLHKTHLEQWRLHMLDGLQKGQKKLRQANLQLDGKIAQLYERNIELFKANKVKSEFLANMSHEFRTPLNAIMGFADILLMEEEDPEKIEPLSIIHSSGATLLHLIESILEFAEIESGRIELKKTDFSMADVLGEVYSSFLEQAQKKDILFTIKKDPAVPRHLLGDESRVTQVFSKLVDNAIKFTSKGEVRLECSYNRTANMAFLRVFDTGEGIPAEKADTIFSVFTQVDMSSSRKHEGIGLGLTIASKLVGRMKGEITFESTPGAGTTFTVRLPLPKVDID